LSNRDIEAKYREKGFYSFSSAWEKLQEEEKKQVFALAEDYKHFLDNGKIERECVEQIVSMARIAGFVELEEMIKAGRQLEPGIKVMAVNRNKAVALFVIGEKPLSEGLRIVGSHIDSPRLDLKPQPLYGRKPGDSPRREQYFFKMNFKGTLCTRSPRYMVLCVQFSYDTTNSILDNLRRQTVRVSQINNFFFRTTWNKFSSNAIRKRTNNCRILVHHN
jgi:hypothetical protein